MTPPNSWGSKYFFFPGYWTSFSQQRISVPIEFLCRHREPLSRQHSSVPRAMLSRSLAQGVSSACQRAVTVNGAIATWKPPPMAQLYRDRKFSITTPDGPTLSRHEKCYVATQELLTCPSPVATEKSLSRQNA